MWSKSKTYCKWLNELNVAGDDIYHIDVATIELYLTLPLKYEVELIRDSVDY